MDKYDINKIIATDEMVRHVGMLIWLKAHKNPVMLEFELGKLMGCNDMAYMLNAISENECNKIMELATRLYMAAKQ